MSHSIVLSVIAAIIGIISSAIVLIVALGVLGFVILAIGKVLSAFHDVFGTKPAREFRSP
ncbi:MAG: hypothetical protein WAU33_03050 [Candidatus Binataceae bacterium]|jgi:hypothetical protein